MAVGRAGNRRRTVSPLNLVAVERALKFRRIRYATQAESRSESTPQQKAALLERERKLRKRVAAWLAMQAKWMPKLSELPSTNPPTSVDKYPLRLPSSLGTTIDIAALVDAPLIDGEFLLRRGQAEEMLALVKDQLLIRSQLQYYKRKQVRHQKQNTRARATLIVIEAKLKAIADKYNRARSAMELLCPGDWSKTLKFMAPNDLRPIQDEEADDHAAIQARLDNGTSSGRARAQREQALGEGHKQMSWIWYVVGMRSEAATADQQSRECHHSIYMCHVDFLH